MLVEILSREPNAKSRSQLHFLAMVKSKTLSTTRVYTRPPAFSDLHK